MERPDLLLTVAEIAIAFAGFAGIASVLGHKRSRDDPRFDAWRLRSMLEAALGAGLFAIAPFIPEAFGLSEAATWRLTATAFLLWSLTGLIMGVRRGRTLQQRGASPSSRGYLFLFSAIELAIELPLLAIVLGLFPGAAAALYLVALVMCLVQAGLFFIRLLSSLLLDAQD